MSPEEKVAFEIRLKEDKELQSDVQEYNHIDDAIKHRDTYKYVSRAMEDLEKRQQSPVRRLVSEPAIRAAAIIVVLLGILAILLWQIEPFKQDTRTLAECFAAEQIDYTFRGENDDIDEMLTTGAQLFNTAEYTKATDQFNKVVNLDPGHIQAKYYLGLSNLYAGNLETATNLFLEVVKSGDMNYSTGARWHLAWCYIQTDEKDKALELLEDLKADGYYGEKVGAVFKALEE